MSCESPNALLCAECVALVIGKKAIHDFLTAIENHVDVPVARGPHIGEEFGALLFGQGGNCVTQLVEGLAQRGSPFLIPSRLAAAASAVRAPALYAMRTTPRGVVDDFALPLGRKLFKVACVVGQLDGLVLLEKAHRVGQRHFTVAMMMAVRFAVGRHAFELGLRSVFESGLEPRRRSFLRNSAGPQKRLRARLRRRRKIL